MKKSIQSYILKNKLSQLFVKEIEPLLLTNDLNDAILVSEIPKQLNQTVKNWELVSVTRIIETFEFDIL